MSCLPLVVSSSTEQNLLILELEMPISLVKKDPFLIELETEEAYEYMKDNRVEDINKVWLRLFLREPTQYEVDQVIQRTQEDGPSQHQSILFSKQTTQIADAYRYTFGPFFSIRKANQICKILFGRMIGLHEAIDVRELIKQSEPHQMSDIYRWIAEQVKMIQKQFPNETLDEIYMRFVLRPPYRFEIQFHNENH